MSHQRQVFGFASVSVLALGLTQAGCKGSSDGDSSGGGGGTHFDSVRTANGHATDQRVNGQVVGEGMVFWHAATSVNGKDALVRVTVYLGPFGSDNNTVLNGEQPYLFPNYTDGAENNRPSSDYAPIVLNRVAGSNVLWDGTIVRFPTNGRFLLSLTRNGSSFTGSNNIYAAGMQRDSSYDAGHQSLSARFDAGRMIVTTPGKP